MLQNMPSTGGREEDRSEWAKEEEGILVSG